jgi:hypothetical protein
MKTPNDIAQKDSPLIINRAIGHRLPDHRSLNMRA